jgi:hypothetical protein
MLCKSCKAEFGAVHSGDDHQKQGKFFISIGHRICQVELQANTFRTRSIRRPCDWPRPPEDTFGPAGHYQSPWPEDCAVFTAENVPSLFAMVGTRGDRYSCSSASPAGRKCY